MQEALSVLRGRRLDAAKPFKKKPGYDEIAPKAAQRP